ncbi:MAG TPA: glycosyltransferase family 4 protein, partial [Gemmatimonadales bacterium]|nr:glycosyltransferase family 4 protein [Gemmatimonadales bacterium]
HLSLGLQQAGFQVRFVCPPDSEVEAGARAGGLEVYPLRLGPNERRANASRLYQLLERHPVDLVNSQSSRDRAALAWLGLTGRLDPPLIITRRQMPRTIAVENWLVSRVAHRVIAVSRTVGEALIRRGTDRRKLVVIPNGLIAGRIDVPVSDQEREEWRARIGWEASRRTIGIVARLKDQAVVLRALDRLAVPVRLVLVGVEPDARLDRLARHVPPRHAVVMLPFTPAVRPLYDVLELVLLPSRIEGFSQSLLEAMALGKPVIASAAAGNQDLITNNVDGRLVEALDADAWCRTIEELLANRPTATRLGEAARHTARETYSLERTVQQTADLYRATLGHG